MIRFIFLSMAFIAISFFAVPAYFGIEKEHQKLTETASVQEPSSDTLTFAEIYDIADQGTIDPAALNAMTPAAGDDTEAEKFSNGFSGNEDSALADTTINAPIPTEVN